MELPCPAAFGGQLLELAPAALEGALEVALLDGTLEVLDGELEVELGEVGAPTLGDAVPGERPVLSLLLCASAPQESAKSAPAVAAAMRLRFMQRLLSWRGWDLPESRSNRHSLHARSVRRAAGLLAVF